MWFLSPRSTSSPLEIANGSSSHRRTSRPMGMKPGRKWVSTAAPLCSLLCNNNRAKTKGEPVSSGSVCLIHCPLTGREDLKFVRPSAPLMMKQDLKKFDLLISDDDARSESLIFSSLNDEARSEEFDLLISDDEARSEEFDLLISDDEARSEEFDLLISDDDARSEEFDLLISDDEARSEESEEFDLLIPDDEARSVKFDLLISDDEARSEEFDLLIPDDEARSVKFDLLISDDEARSVKFDLLISDDEARSVKFDLLISDDEARSVNLSDPSAPLMAKQDLNSFDLLISDDEARSEKFDLLISDNEARSEKFDSSAPLMAKQDLNNTRCHSGVFLDFGVSSRLHSFIDSDLLVQIVFIVLALVHLLEDVFTIYEGIIRKSIA
ncbi:hypothetical protein GQ457_15G014400 [Hibiscus cannabinus]